MQADRKPVGPEQSSRPQGGSAFLSEREIVEEENRRLMQKLMDKDKEIAALRKRLDEQERLVQELKEEFEAGAGRDPESDVAQYEAELNEFRRQLEADRKTLDEEIRQLRSRNEELVQTLRESELEMSRERANLARERHQLNRLRDELRMEIERATRDFDVRQGLARVQGLKSGAAQPGKGGDAPIAQRLKDFWQRLGSGDEK
jgi:chromosome segregation ATPase